MATAKRAGIDGSCCEPVFDGIPGVGVEEGLGGTVGSNIGVAVRTGGETLGAAGRTLVGATIPGCLVVAVWDGADLTAVIAPDGMAAMSPAAVGTSRVYTSASSPPIIKAATIAR